MKTRTSAASPTGMPTFLPMVLSASQRCNCSCAESGAVRLSGTFSSENTEGNTDVRITMQYCSVCHQIFQAAVVLGSGTYGPARVSCAQVGRTDKFTLERLHQIPALMLPVTLKRVPCKSSPATSSRSCLETQASASLPLPLSTKHGGTVIPQAPFVSEKPSCRSVDYFAENSNYSPGKSNHPSDVRLRLRPRHTSKN